MGDAADNIPGCPGVGPKTAARLIAEFDSIDGLLAHTAQLKGALRQKVEDNAEQIRFSRYLATIRTDVPLTPDFEAMRLGRPTPSSSAPFLTNWNSARCWSVCSKPRTCAIRSHRHARFVQRSAGRRRAGRKTNQPQHVGRRAAQLSSD